MHVCMCACPWRAWHRARGKNKLYLTSCVIQSQQVLLSPDVDAHCKEMTKSSLEEEPRGEGGECWWVGGFPAPLCYEDDKQVVLIIATDAMQLEEEWWGGGL